ncbi:MAG: hypothetical protein V1763_02540 [Parcubacteria group bacterium]
MDYPSKEEREEEFARQNSEYLAAKREALAELKGELPEKKKKGNKFFCCLIVLMIVALCSYVIFYFIIKTKDSLRAGYTTTQAQLQSALPQAQNEIRTSIDQGVALVDNTTQTINSLNQAYQKARGLFEWVNGVYEKLRGLNDISK